MLLKNFKILCLTFLLLVLSACGGIGSDGESHSISEQASSQDLNQSPVSIDTAQPSQQEQQEEAESNVEASPQMVVTAQISTSPSSSGVAPLAIQFNSAGSQYDQNDVSVVWNFGDGATSTDLNPNHTFSAAGNYTIRLTVSSGGNQATATTTVNVDAAQPANNLPVATIAVNVEGGMAPLTVEFNGSSSMDIDGNIVSYAWNFGDGGNSNLVDPSHTFVSAGNYNVTLTVTDNQGSTNNATQRIQVTAPGGVVSSLGCSNSNPDLALTKTLLYPNAAVDALKDRFFKIEAPANYDPSNPYKVMFAMHGAGGDVSPTINDAERIRPDGVDQVIFVYPHGEYRIPNNPGHGNGWDTRSADNNVDLVFFDDMVEHVKNNWCVNESAIFATGFSWGGWMATQLACERPNVFRGIASYAGGGPINCTINQPVAAYLAHGYNDEVESVSSGRSTRNKFIGVNNCVATRTDIDPNNTNLVYIEYFDCDDDSNPVIWWQHQGEHSDWGKNEAWEFLNNLNN